MDSVISTNYALKDMEGIAQQWQMLILELLYRFQGSLTENVVVITDALDENGAKATRKVVLDIFASQGAELPANIRMLLTSRPLVNIREALHTEQHNHRQILG